MSSNLLPHRGQPATPVLALNASTGSNLDGSGSRRVAGWVAGCSDNFCLIYALSSVGGSKGSNFLKKLRTREKGKKRIGITIGTTCYTCYPATVNGTP